MKFMFDNDAAKILTEGIDKGFSIYNIKVPYRPTKEEIVVYHRIYKGRKYDIAEVYTTDETTGRVQIWYYELEGGEVNDT